MHLLLHCCLPRIRKPVDSTGRDCRATDVFDSDGFAEETSRSSSFAHAFVEQFSHTTLLAKFVEDVFGVFCGDARVDADLCFGTFLTQLAEFGRFIPVVEDQRSFFIFTAPLALDVIAQRERELERSLLDGLTVGEIDLSYLAAGHGPASTSALETPIPHCVGAQHFRRFNSKLLHPARNGAALARLVELDALSQPLI